MKITAPVETCMVFFDAGEIGLRSEEIMARGEALERPIKMFEGGRLVVSALESFQWTELICVCRFISRRRMRPSMI